MERTCSMCGGQKKELFSSTYCPRCEDRTPIAGQLSVDDAVHYLSAHLPANCSVSHEKTRWGSCDRVNLDIIEKDPNTIWGLSYKHTVTLRGAGCSSSFLDEWIRILRGTP